MDSPLNESRIQQKKKAHLEDLRKAEHWCLESGSQCGRKRRLDLAGPPGGVDVMEEK